jgi:transcriptional regulator with XRE-family HTH domain
MEVSRCEVEGASRGKGISHLELANSLHMLASTYNQYELVRRKLPYDKLFELAEYFEVTTDYLLGFKQKIILLHEKRASLQNDVFFSCRKNSFGVLRIRTRRLHMVNKW